MPVLNSLKFRKGLNKRLVTRNRAKSRTIAAEHELKRAQHHLTAFPKSVSQNGVLDKKAIEVRERKLRLVDRLESNHTGEAVELAAAERKVRQAKELRKHPVIGRIRLGRFIADVFFNSGKVDVVKRKMERVFSVSKKAQSKAVPLPQSGPSRLTFKKGASSKSGPMMGKSPKA
jgi:hypothetical protein